MLQFLSLSKSNIKPGLKEIMDYKEKQNYRFLKYAESEKDSTERAAFESSDSAYAATTISDSSRSIS